MIVKAIVKEHLDANGFDGLFLSDGGCACKKEELAPCENVGLKCKPGYLLDATDSEYDFVIGLPKPE